MKPEKAHRLYKILRYIPISWVIASGFIIIICFGTSGNSDGGDNWAWNQQ